jgi:hypothetical protein
MAEDRKEYGPHTYRDSGAGGCFNGCGCWIEGAAADGPIGLDPHGKCPRNPVDGKRLSTAANPYADHAYVANQRIADLERRAAGAEEELAQSKRLLATIDASALKMADLMCTTASALNSLAGILPPPETPQGQIQPPFGDDPHDLGEEVDTI